MKLDKSMLLGWRATQTAGKASAAVEIANNSFAKIGSIKAGASKVGGVKVGIIKPV